MFCSVLFLQIYPFKKKKPSHYSTHPALGDLLYMPRGFVHQACTHIVEGESEAGRGRGPQHSLHVTVSTYHRSAWADMMVGVSA